MPCLHPVSRTREIIRRLVGIPKGRDIAVLLPATIFRLLVAHGLPIYRLCLGPKCGWNNALFAGWRKLAVIWP